jgi:hypothetical protein
VTGNQALSMEQLTAAHREIEAGQRSGIEVPIRVGDVRNSVDESGRPPAVTWANARTRVLDPTSVDSPRPSGDVRDL